MKASLLKEKAIEIAASHPRFDQRRRADALNVSEGALVAAYCGDGAVRLRHDWPSLFNAMATLPPATHVTRNRSAVLEVFETAPSCQSFEGLLWMSRSLQTLCVVAERVSEAFLLDSTVDPGNPAPSIQFFTGDGIAIHKCFFEASSDNLLSKNSILSQEDSSANHARPDDDIAKEPTIKADDDWMSEFARQHRHRYQNPDFEWHHSSASLGGDIEHSVAGSPDADTLTALSTGWNAMTGPLDPRRLCARFGIGRLTLLRLVGESYCQLLERDAVSVALSSAAKAGLSLQIEVDNGTFSHFFVTPEAVSNPVSFGKWINLLAPTYNLHLDDTQIHQVWRARLPGRHGDQWVIEVFDKANRLALRISSPAEDSAIQRVWTQLVNALSARSLEEAMT